MNINRYSNFSSVETLAGSYLSPLLGKHYEYLEPISASPNAKARAFLKEDRESWQSSCLKIVSYITIILPLFAAISLFISRTLHQKYFSNLVLLEKKFFPIQVTSADAVPERKEGTLSLITHISDTRDTQIKTLHYPAPEPGQGTEKRPAGKKYEEVIAEIIARYPAHRELLTKGFDAMDIISFRELQLAFKGCLDQFLADIPVGERCTIAMLEGKSSAWMAQMAAEFLPPQIFDKVTTYQTDKGGNWDSWNLINSTSGNIVLFEDASYSGRQIANAIRSLTSELKNKDSRYSCRFSLVIPFLSKRAFKEIEKAANASSCEIRLYTTGRRLKQTSDFFSTDEMRILEEKFSLLRDSGVTLPQTCLTTTAWKLPDTASLPYIFSSPVKECKTLNGRTDISCFYPFGNPQEPYKKESEDSE